MPRSSQFLGGLSSGLAKGAAAFLGGDQAYQGGYDQQLGLQSKIAQAIAAARAADANAEESMAKAGIERTKQRFLDNRPALVDELVAGNSGTDVPMVQALRKYMQTGQRAQVPMGPETEDGQMGVGSQQFDPAVQSRVTQQLMRMAPALLGAGDIKVDDWAKAQEAYRGMDLGDQVLSGSRNAGDVGRAQAAVAAKPLYNSDANGAVLDLFGGALDTSNPMAQGTIALKKEQAGAQKANAVQSYASADNSRASAAKTRSEMEQGVKTGALQVVTGDDGVTRVINKATGQAQQVTDAATGAPLVQGGKPLPEAAQKQITGARNLQDAVGGYLKALEGWSNKKMLSPDDRAAMGNAYNNMMLQAKEAYNLGVLNGPDYDILQSVVKDPTKWTSIAVSNEALGNQAKSLRDIAANIERTSLESHGRKYTPRTQPSTAAPAQSPQRNVVVDF